MTMPDCAAGANQSTLLVLGSGRREFRDYALAAAAARHRLVLLERTPLTWERSYVAEHVQTPFTADAVLPLARSLAVRHKVAGVFTYDETAVELVSVIAAELGLPGIEPGCARRCRDKLAMRLALASAGVPSAVSLLVTSAAEAAAVAAEIGFPVVVKPRALAGSIGVVRVDRPADLRAAYEVACAAGHHKFGRLSGVLIEEYLNGPEYSVESIVVEGRVHIVAVTEKQLGFAPYFEELGHVVCAEDPLWRDDRIAAVTTQAHQALGICTGATHAELRVTPDGPHIIEVAGRLAGDTIPHLVQLATGVDLTGAATDVAAGQGADVTPTHRAAAAVRMLYPRAAGRVRALGMADEALRHAWLERVRWTAAPGDELRLPPGGFMSRLGFLVVTADCASACRERLAHAESLAHIDLVPRATNGHVREERLE